MIKNPSPPEISLSKFVRTVELLLDGESKIVVVEGPDGMGKSTFLRQFAAAYPERALLLSVSGASRWAYNPAQLERDLYSQIAELLQRDVDIATDVDRVDLSGAFNALHRLIRRGKEPFYFILDGLEDIPPQDDAARVQILGLLPFGRDGFRFLISAHRAADVPFEPAARRLVRGFPLSYFGIEETAKYLRAFEPTPEQVAEVIKITRGLPLMLASIWRLLANGRDFDQLLANLPNELPELFELEWGSIDEDAEGFCLALAIVANEHRAFSIPELAHITGAAASELADNFNGINFVEVDEEDIVRFSSAVMKRFAADRLATHRQLAQDALISYLANDPDSEDALTNLPSYFSNAEKLQDLVQYLSPERFARMYQKTTSLKVVKQNADHGIAAAEKLGQEHDLVRFMLQRAAIEEISTSRIGVAEVRARAAVGDYETALALAEAATRTEVRLQLLAAIARVRKDNDLHEDLELTARIREVYDQLDPDALDSHLSDIAIDLFHSSPELAIELVSQRQGQDQGENAIDWAIAGLVIQAQLAKDDPNVKRHSRELHEKIKDPSLRRLSMHAVAVLGDMSASEIIREVSHLESTGDKLYLLQHWMIANRTRQNASDVLEYGLRLAIQATSYTATAKVYRELALCLPHISDPARRSELIELLDGQRSVLERLGPPEEYIRLQLILARAAARHDKLGSYDRLVSIYFEVEGIDDPVVKVACKARLAAAIALIDPSGRMDQELRLLVDTEFVAELGDLLSQSAEHFDVCRGVIRALAASRPKAVLEVIQKMNTEWRRDLGYQEFVEAAIAAPLSEAPFKEMVEALDLIATPDIFDAALQSIDVYLPSRRLTEDQLNMVRPLLDRIDRIHGAALRARTAARLAVWINQAGRQSEQLRRKLLRTTRDAWTEMDSSWQKLNAGFDIVTELARTEPVAAKEYVDEINGLQNHLVIQDAETTAAACMGVLLAIRALVGLLKFHLESADDIERLYVAIESCGSLAVQARLLSDLAVRCKFAGRKDLCEAIVQDRLLPLTAAMNEGNAAFRNRVIQESAAALYLGSPAAGLGHIRSLPEPWRDEALGMIARVLITRTPPDDAFEWRPHQGSPITFETACAVIELLQDMSTDWRIAGIIEDVVESVRRSTGEIKRAQQADIVQRLERVAESTLPAPRFIEHKGYQIFARAHINRLRNPNDRISPDVLAGEAREIPNTADRAYVLAVVGATTNNRKISRALLNEALEIVDSIPMLTDRLGRYELLSSLAVEVDESWSRELLRKAFRLASQGEGDSIDERRRSLINSAYRIDPDFAASLTQISDDDPAKSKVERQLQIYRIRDAIARRRPPAEGIPEGSAREFARAAWLRLGSLNAGRISPVSAQYVLPILQYAAVQSTSEAYPLFAFYIENAVRHASNSQHVRSYVLPLFEACLRGAELAILTADGGATRRSRSLSLVSAERGNLIEEGERQHGIKEIREWLAEQPDDAEIFISEPYFRPQDISLLRHIQDFLGKAVVIILTSRGSLGGVSEMPDEVYRSAWYKERNDPPPETKVIVAESRKSRETPVHDRFWLSNNGGVEIGTSYGGIGSRASRVIRLGAEEAQAILERLRPYFNQQRVEFKGERMKYYAFDIE